MNRLISPVVVAFVLLTLLCFVSVNTARGDSAAEEAERILHDAELTTDGETLLAFFHARARTAIDGEHLQRLMRQFVAGSDEQRLQATAELLGLGPLALPIVRQTLSEVDHSDASQRAARCLPWLEGESSHKLLIAAARVLAQRKPDGAAAALLAYLPYADQTEVIAAVNAALVAVAAPAGKADPALLRGLSDALAVRRAAASVALCRAVPPEQVPDVRKLLKDPSATVRLSTALALAKASDPDAIPVLIDLLADLPADQRQPIEECLSQLAGEWTPIAQLGSDDKIARKIRRDAWRAWWNNTDGEALLGVVREHTLTAEMRQKVRRLLVNLGDAEFSIRESADQDLHQLGRITLPQLREAIASKDLEVASRARRLVERIEREPTRNLPAAAVRLLALRKPPGAAEALLAYLPLAEEENLNDEVKKTLAVLAIREDKIDADLVRALDDELPRIRAVAAEALVKGGGREGRAAVRKLLEDKAASVRLSVALALVTAGERRGVPVLIDLLPVASDEQIGQVEDALHQLAGDKAPETPLGSDAAEKQKCRDAWAAWWKTHGEGVDLARLNARPWYGYTLLCDSSRNRVFEIDRNGKERWAINGVPFPVDAWVVGGNRVLIAEYNGGKVSERDFKGKILWSKEGLPQPVNVQRLTNGNTFIATMNLIVEVERGGKELYRINNVPGGITAAYRARNGRIVCLAQTGQCLLMDTKGNQLKKFASNRNAGWTSGLDLLSNGHILITQPNRNKVAEYDVEGKLIVEVNAPQATTATGLPNGHFLVASNNTQRAFEVDRNGKVVWDHKEGGNIFRARRR